MKINLKNGEAMSFTKKFQMNIFEIRDILDRLKIPDDKPIVQFVQPEQQLDEDLEEDFEIEMGGLSL